jgi:lipoprotein-anchoring transpeptidase ErfK/SrfK
MIKESSMKRANALRPSAAPGAFWRLAMLGTAGTVGAAAPADAAYFWGEANPGYYSQQPFIQPPPRRSPPRAHKPAKKEIIKDTSVHPQMPLIINVSIAKQKVRVYDANGFFAESPISTGVPGHPTPMGVFSVIQKDRYHHSNIYSGAPMPYMQRITWGGVALHAGVVPGHPASHGCFRMPESFAVKMWGWTKMGARVIVSPGELLPSSFEHALLPAMKIAPQPQVSEPAETNGQVGPKADKGADIKPIEANLELRSTVGHTDDPAQRDKTRTADAGANGPAARPVLSDASSGEPAREDATDAAAAAKPVAEAASRPKSETTPDQVETAAKAATDSATAEAGSVKAAQQSAEAGATTAKPDTLKSEPAKTATPTAAKENGAAPAADTRKDETRMSGSDKPPKPDARRKEGQLAVFISRKDSKLYVRQNFAPAWEVPVTIAPSDRPLGTHVFTATVDRKDTNLLHWSVVTVPMSARAAMRAGDEPLHRRHKGKARPAPVEARPVPLPDNPAEALDRITIPPEVMARISEALTTGGSIVVSDQGINQGETGEYTDFIIRTY